MYQAGCSLLSVKCDKDIHLPTDKENVGRSWSGWHTKEVCQDIGSLVILQAIILLLKKKGEKNVKKKKNCREEDD